jgi:hypothetical protein
MKKKEKKRDIKESHVKQVYTHGPEHKCVPDSKGYKRNENMMTIFLQIKVVLLTLFPSSSNMNINFHILLIFDRNTRESLH